MSNLARDLHFVVASRELPGLDYRSKQSGLWLARVSALWQML